MRVARSRWLVLVVLVVVGQATAAQGQEAAKSDSPFKELKYRSIGPSAGGRVCRVSGVPGNPLIYHAATASGGVWRSVDGGLTWSCTTDTLSNSSAGSIAVAPSDPNIVYMGAGEANIRGNVLVGDGIYKSTDGGASWKHVWSQMGQIGTMIVHPRNPEIAFAAVLGHAFGPNGERGVYRTTDGGKTWKPVLQKDSDTGASDVCFDPTNPNILFAGFWQTRRKPWELTSGGPGSGLYVSRDGGDTWTQLTEKGLPKGIWGKVGVAVAPSDGRRVYALIEAEEGGLFRSDDGGKTWSRVSSSRGLRQRAWYYSTITVDPINPDVLWCPNVPMLKSIDGGKTFTAVKGIHHGDHHDIWIDPLNPRRMIAANDGGVDLTLNGGETWTAPPLPISQFYRINVDTRTPYHVSGTMQDLGSAAGPSRGLNGKGIALSDWYNAGGGETGYTAHDAKDPNIIYAGEYAGFITRYDHRTGLTRMVGAFVENPSGHGAEDMKYRFRWPAPILLSPHDSTTLYHAANVVFKSTDGGKSWTTISPDLTRDDKARQRWSGGPITGDNTTAEFFCTISAFAESPKQKDLLWTGSDDGLVHLSRDGGKTWKNLSANLPGLPEWATIFMIEPSSFDAAAAYLVVDAHLLDDFHPYVYHTTDHGSTWVKISDSLPQEIPARVVRHDPTVKGLLYLGTDRGVMISRNDGQSWSDLRLNLPTVPVNDLVVKGDDLVVGTQGRSLWILDDLTPIRRWGPELAEKPAAILPIEPAVRWHSAYRLGAEAVADNPPDGPVIHYWLKDKPADPSSLSLQIVDATGQVARTFRGKPRDADRKGGKKPAEAPEIEEEMERIENPSGHHDPARRDAVLDTEPGLHRFVWDLTHSGAYAIKGAQIDAGNPSQGPLAIPGKYVAKLSMGETTASVEFEIQPDPRDPTPAADLAEQLKLALEVRADFDRLSDAVERIRLLRKQLSDRARLIQSLEPAKPLREASRSLIDKLDALEAQLHNPKAEVPYDILAMKGGAKLYSRLGWLTNAVFDAGGPPTQGAKEAHALLHEELTRKLAEFQNVLDQDLVQANTLAKSLDLPHVLILPPRKS